MQEEKQIEDAFFSYMTLSEEEVDLLGQAHAIMTSGANKLLRAPASPTTPYKDPTPLFDAMRKALQVEERIQFATIDLAIEGLEYGLGYSESICCLLMLQ